MEAQEIFDTVAKHLIAQGRPASVGDICYYRMPDGAKCALGVLIPNECYTPEMEHNDVHWLIEGGRLLSGERFEGYACLAHLKPHLNLVADLQRAHDSWACYAYYDELDPDIADLEARLRDVAAKHGLNVSVLEPAHV